MKNHTTLSVTFNLIYIQDTISNPFQKCQTMTLIMENVQINVKLTLQVRIIIQDYYISNHKNQLNK